MKYNKENFIGIFDSGIGGISVLNELIKLMPQENYIYFADSSNFPYGKKNKSELVNIGSNILSKFSINNAKSVVIACNTMSTSDIESFINKYPSLKIIGTFPSFIHIFKPNLILSEDNISYDKENGLEINRFKKKLLVIATTSTCKSQYLSDLVDNSKMLIDVYIEPADFIAKAVENDLLNTCQFKTELSELFKEYMDIDYLVLGCTHFPFAINKIRDILTSKTIITSGCEMSANNCYKYLSDNKLLTNNINPFIRIIDCNINDDKKELYKKLIDSNEILHNIEFKKSF